ncbi:hypothetical protein MUO14_02805 [Halobacillus shinanisalinarum]|uniref:Uncharacterized protein n=1 Tax=Halobacillus shinanisalinarum TaxID=2932258 RepID=A0ABY4H1A0_9BACI|nr:CBO0543 family protein [Halobacillus shinanisalinarum]UOQ93929.1 hypothetical protein MUO14_02805 [Halobacillus shinanisalinarum]
MVEIILLWIFYILGATLLLFSLKKPPRRNWLLIYFTTAYFAVFLGNLIVEYHFLTFPVTLFKHLDGSVLFEFLLFPVICIYYYQTTYHSAIFGIVWQAAVYSGALTIVESFLEMYTDLIKYLQWDWYYTWISVFIFMVIVRSSMGLLNNRP